MSSTAQHHLFTFRHTILQTPTHFTGIYTYLRTYDESGCLGQRGENGSGIKMENYNTAYGKKKKSSQYRSPHFKFPKPLLLIPFGKFSFFSCNLEESFHPSCSPLHSLRQPYLLQQSSLCQIFLHLYLQQDSLVLLNLLTSHCTFLLLAKLNTMSIVFTFNLDTALSKISCFYHHHSFSP